MAEVGSAWVTVAPSAKGFGRQLDKEVGPDLDKSGKAGSKRFGSAFGSTLKSAIGPAVAIIGTAAISGFLKGSIDEASDLGETLNKSAAIFGKNADEIERFGDTAAKSLGLSKSEAIAAAASFGDMFSQIGFGGNQAAKMSKDVVKLSADLGSFNNLGTEDVAQRISAAFRGEYDSLQALIPNINAARVESEALATTGKKTAKELTAQEKAAAVLAIVHKDGARAVGDFAKTSGGLANQQKILSAQTADLRAQVGAALLPAMTKLASYLNKEAVPAISGFIKGMQDGTGSGGELAGTLRDIWNAAKPIASTVVSAVRGFGGLPGATQKVILLAGAALLLKNRFSGVLPTLQSFDKTTALATAKTVAMRGGAMAAGAGLAALASNAGGANTELGALATIGAGIATGFAVGGPWGAAIGGGASALAVFSSQSQAAASAQDALDSAGKRVAATLDQQTGALTENSRAVAAKELADSGALAAGKAMGISLNDILDASLGSTQALYRVSAASEAWADSQARAGTYTEKQEGQLVTLRDAIGKTSTSLVEQRAKISQVNEALGKGTGGANKFGKSLDAVGKKRPSPKTSTPGLTSALSGVATLGSRLSKVDKMHVKPSVSVTGLGGALAGLASLGRSIQSAIDKSKRLKVGANAKGTDNWRGGLTMVGEKGPELINLAKGAQVIPNHKLGDVGGHGTAAAYSAGGPMDLSDSTISALIDGLLDVLEVGTSNAIDSQAQYTSLLERTNR